MDDKCDQRTHEVTEEVFGIFTSKGLMQYRINDEDETVLDVDDLRQWNHFKHPKVRYFDVVWRLKSFVVSPCWSDRRSPM